MKITLLIHQLHHASMQRHWSEDVDLERISNSRCMSLTCSCLWFTSTRQTLSKITDFTYSMAWFSQSFKSSNYLQFSARIFNVHYLNIVYSSLLLPLSKEATYQKSLPKTLGVHVLDKFPDLHWYSNLVTLKAKWKWVAFSTGRCSISSS